MLHPYLPVELWRKILRDATLEDVCRTSSMGIVIHPQPFPDRGALRTKLALMLVSTRWNALASEFLWEYVGNHTQDQLVDIARRLALDRKRGGSGWWIRALHPRFNFGDNIDIFISSIISILECCPNLESFVHIHDFNGPFPTGVISALIQHCGQTLRKFQLDWGGADMDDLVFLLDKLPRLQQLSVGCTFAPISFENIPRNESLCFNELKSIHFGNAEDRMTRKFNCHLLEATKWAMPALAAVSIDLDARTSVDEVVGFLQAHGPRLTSLSLTDSGRTDGLALDWTQIFNLCPDLVELRLSFNPFLRLSTGDGANHQHHLPLINSSARKLRRLCFVAWEFFPLSDCVLSLADTSSPADAPQLQLILDREFDPLGKSHLTPVLKNVQFDFLIGRLDLAKCSLGWWQDWLKKWADRGLVVEGCNEEILNSVA